MKDLTSTEREIGSLLEEADGLRSSNVSKSISLAQKAIALTPSDNVTLHALALNKLALFFMIKGEFSQAIELSEKALGFFEEVNDLKGIADAKYNIANAYYKTDNFHVGLKHLLDCYQLYRQLQDYYNEARVLKSIGTLYEYFGDLDNAVESYEKCIEAAEKVGDEDLVSNAYNLLSGIYLKQEKTTDALVVIEKSIRIKTRTQDTPGLGYAFYGRAKVYLKLRDYEQAFNDFNQALDIHQQTGETVGEVMTLNKLGSSYLACREYDQAEALFLCAMSKAEGQGSQLMRFKINYNLYLLFTEKGDAIRALTYLEKYIRLKEAVINTHTHNIIKSYESIKKIESLAQEARRQQEKAEIIERKNAELDSFFYRISHDLKGPISSLLGLHNLILLEITDQPSLEYFHLYQSQIQRINNIVMDLINLTRMNHDAETRTKINFNRLVEECIGSYHYLDGYDRIDFVVSIEKELEYVSESAIVNTILQNLIENAIKYIRLDVKPYVGVFIYEEDGKLVIKVKDNGQGIRQEDQSKIFNMFFRATDRQQGTGLGLYILKRAIERLNGEITLKSQKNVGSTFVATLPK